MRSGLKNENLDMSSSDDPQEVQDVTTQAMQKSSSPAFEHHGSSRERLSASFDHLASEDHTLSRSGTHVALDRVRDHLLRSMPSNIRESLPIEEEAANSQELTSKLHNHVCAKQGIVSRNAAPWSPWEEEDTIMKDEHGGNSTNSAILSAPDHAQSTDVAFRGLSSIAVDFDDIELDQTDYPWRPFSWDESTAVDEYNSIENRRKYYKIVQDRRTAVLEKLFAKMDEQEAEQQSEANAKDKSKSCTHSGSGPISYHSAPESFQESEEDTYLREEFEAFSQTSANVMRSMYQEYKSKLAQNKAGEKSDKEAGERD